LNDLVDAVKVVRVIEGFMMGFYVRIRLAAETAASMTIAHPDYAQLARIYFEFALYNKIVLRDDD
jgi:ribonucleoside-diphosphate reductase alpha chain